MAKDRIRRRIVINGKTQWITGNTEQEYAERLMKAMNKAAISQQPEKNNFKDYADYWFQVFSKPNVSETTAVTYERQLRRYIYPVLEGFFVEDLQPVNIQQLFNIMDHGKTLLSKASKQKVKNVLNMILEQAVEDQLLPRNPLTSKSLRITGRASQATPLYSVEQMSYIIAHINDVKQQNDRHYIALQALHPLRLEEVLGLRWEDIDFQNNIIQVRNTVTHPTRNQGVFEEKTKTDAIRRKIKLVEQIKKFLLPGPSEAFVVGGKRPLSCGLVKQMCKRIQQDMNFEERITPRRFRTTILTDIYDVTKDIKQVQKAAGHTTAAMTLQHYVQGRERIGDTAAPLANAYGLMSDEFVTR